MFIQKKALPRRTFLKGLGATLALPFLDAMAPRQLGGGAMHRIIRACLSMVFLAVLTGTVSGQTISAGQISGRITDRSGAVLPGVEVRATQTSTGLVRPTLTNETGSYTLPNLPLGPYQLAAVLPGFRTFVQTGITIQVNAHFVIDAVLEVGEVTQTIEVQANLEAQVETRSLGVGQLIESRRILELPLAARDVNSLIMLSGAAVQTGQSPGFGMATGINVSVAGGQSFGVAYLLDGAMHTNPYDATGMPTPFPDALLEFRVQTSTQGAETGRASGAAVNAVTRSGTNQFHGDVFWFVRNAVFNAKDSDALAKDQLKRNQFGGTIGGPIVKNRLFFFTGYQGTKVRQTPSSTLAIVPTKALLSGDWTEYNRCYNPAWRDADFRDDFVDPARYSNAAKLISAKLPAPTGNCGEIRYGSRTERNDWQDVSRVDFQQSSKHTIFGRYMATQNLRPHEFGGANLLAMNIAGEDDLAQSATVGSTYVIDPGTVNSFRVALNRFGLLHQGNEFFSKKDVGIMNTWDDPEIPKYFNLVVQGLFNFGTGTNARKTQTMQQIQAGNDLSLTRGTHQFGLGGTWAKVRNDSVGHVRSPGNLTINTQITGNAMGDFLLGELFEMRQSMPNPIATYQNYLGIYGTDTWRATPRLTLNYGLRWEPFFPQVAMEDPSDGSIRIYSFDAAQFKQGRKSTVFPAAPAGFTYPGDSGFIGRQAIQTGWKNFSPRVGLAWDPRGNGRTSIRASYGIAYDVVGLALGQNQVNVAPWSNDTIYRNTKLDDPWQGFPGGNPFPSDWRKDAKFFEGSVFIATPPDIASTYVSSWNFGVQRQIARDWLVSANYLGGETTHVWGVKALNPSIFITPQTHPGLFTGPNTCVLEGASYTPCNTLNNINQRRELRLWAAQNKPSLLNDAKLFTFLDAFDDGATASYNGLLLSTRGRVRSVNVNVNYTWSHCLSDAAAGLVPNPGATPLRGRDRGACDSDRRHIFNMTAVAETPRFANPGMRAVLSDWRLSLINRISSGNYLTISSGVDWGRIGLTARADQLFDDVYKDRSGHLNSQFLNPAAFRSPVEGSLGNIGRASVRGVGTWSLDAALSRSFRLTEAQRFEVRAEAFNVTNTARPNNPVVNINNANFGKITGLQPARVMQFALKYVF
jgi:hypothetical protein